MMSSFLFRDSQVHHAPVPRKLSDRATLIWGVIWTLISLTTIAASGFVGQTPWDPLWVVVTIIGIALTATLGGAASRLDATLIFSTSSATLVPLYLGADLGTALAVWGTANLITLMVRIRHVWDAAEQLAYVLGSALIALLVVDWLREDGWREAYTAVGLIVYFAARFTISTIRMSIVTAISIRESIAAIIPIRAAGFVFGITIVAMGCRAVQIHVAERNPELGEYWGVSIVAVIFGISALILAMVWTMKVIKTQLHGIHSAALALPWPEAKPIAQSAEGFVRQALPNYEIEFRKDAGRNINEICSPMADGHLIARRGNNQAPLLEADQLVLDSIAHIGDTMVTVRKDHDRLFRQALTDTMTGLPNYRAFIDVLDETAREATAGFAVVYIDLDGFKAVNDRYGHESGNIILHTLGARFRAELTDDEFVARVGGDEFVLILSDIDDEQTGHVRVRQLLETVSGPVRVGESTIPVILSYGLSHSLPGDTDAWRLVDEADSLMYASRGERREGGVLRSEPHSTNMIARGIEQSALSFAYQPIVDTDTDTIIGVEALVRSKGSFFEGESAEQIIERARFEGQLTELSVYLMKTAAADMNRFQEIVPELTSLHVNIDVEQIVGDEFVDALRCEWEGTGLDLTLELGESSLGRRLDKVTTRLEKMIETPGLHVALDDFGSEACTLESVIHFPFDILKVDKAIPMSLGTKKTDIVAVTIIRLAEETGARVIFEGVEDDRTYEKLRSLGVRYMQGYRFAKPLFPDEFCDRLRAHGLAAIINQPV